MIAYTKNKPEFMISAAKEIQTQNGKITSTYSTFSATDFGKYLSGYRLPNFRNIIESGGDATTPLSARQSDLLYLRPTTGYARGMSGTIVVEQFIINSTDGLINGLDTAIGSFPSSLESTCSQLLSLKAYNKLGSQFKGATFLAEMKETISMIRGRAAAMSARLNNHAKRMQAVRRRLWYGPLPIDRVRARFQKAASDAWLEFNFGWAPLVSDLNECIAAYRDYMNSPGIEPFVVRVRLNQNEQRTLVTSWGWRYFNHRQYKSRNYEMLGKYYGATRVQKSGPEFAMASFGLGASDWIPAAWEVVPWSFVMDYFTDIGNSLDAWVTAQRVDYARLASTFVKSMRTTREDVPVLAFPESHTGHATPGISIVSTKQVTRSKMSAIPLPSMMVRNKLSFSKDLNLLSLFETRRQDHIFAECVATCNAIGGRRKRCRC